MPFIAEDPAELSALPAFLSPAQLAAHLGVSLATAYRRIEDGTFPHVQIGALLRVPRTALEKLTAPIS
jgi:excisionase family DNA binding protein